MGRFGRIRSTASRAAVPCPVQVTHASTTTNCWLERPSSRHA